MSESETPVPASTPADPVAAAEVAPTAESTTPETVPPGETAPSVEAPADETAAAAPADPSAEQTESAEPTVTAETDDAAAADAPEAPATPAAAPRPSAPKPGLPSPAALAGRRAAAPLVPIAPPVSTHDPEAVAAARAFGTLGEDGTVSVQDGTQVRAVGTSTESDPEKALEPFVHAYLDLVAFLDLTQSTLNAPEHTQNELNRLLENLRKNMKEPQVVGDIPALRARAHELRENAKEKIQALEAKRAEGRAEATRRRTEFVESIEALVATDPEQISWKNAGDTMRQMVPTWKQMQSEDVSLDRPTEEALWKRLSAARATFDRLRKQFFSQLDERHSEAATVKEQLISRAEAMQDSTDWGPTVRAYKDLMDEWRAAPRGSRKKDDAQWKRFKAAQDAFFAARNADLHETEAEQRKNLEVKESLLVEAEAIDAVKDLDAAKAALRSIQDRWEEAGKVPRADMRRVDDRLRAVERAVKDAEQAEWRRTDPRTKARVEGASSQLHSAIASYEEALEKARAGGDPKKIAEAEAALEARKEWLAVIERSARDLG
ncbi:DUF349 domain-containing protein [Brachybacterium sp. J144]|uniref:DUF349 domain-containing protein n=1 Tax=unclassified Brachybacterium TaxID=2623841 RepID=UPI002E792C3F|nr:MULTISPECIES: DUF349 domain-containing protein [unclassified Brachybacterium]MEE1617637.1 DUF349 domain-containing protein [Brachybacterium sp. J153]MEE1651338.1 DUF349 domain-containing protein [Brachybacterium sp. J144]